MAIGLHGKKRDGTILVEGFVTAMMGDWGYFEEEITLDPDLEENTELVLEIFTESPKDGTVEDLVTIETLHTAVQP